MENDGVRNGKGSREVREEERKSSRKGGRERGRKNRGEGKKSEEWRKGNREGRKSREEKTSFGKMKIRERKEIIFRQPGWNKVRLIFFFRSFSDKENAEIKAFLGKGILLNAAQVPDFNNEKQ